MKKAIKFTYYLALWISALFILAMLMTYFSEWLQATGFFGDIPQTLNGHSDEMDPAHKWGTRHYWYFALCFCLFLLSLIRICIWGCYYWEEEINNQYRDFSK